MVRREGAMTRLCSIEGCGRPVDARGWCKAHWKRWRRHGDPLGGGTPYGEPMAFLEAAAASVSDECILWPYASIPAQYGYIRIDGKAQPAHRVVCEMAHGPAPSPDHQAAHDNDGQPCKSPLCVNPNHLRWATPRENNADKTNHDTLNRGERNSNAKLSEAEVGQILALRGVKSQREIAEMFDVAQSRVSLIHSGLAWRHLKGKPDAQAPLKSGDTAQSRQ